MRTIGMLAAGAAVVLAGLQIQQGEAAPSRRTIEREKALADAKPAGEPIDCVQLTSIRETRVRSDQVIDFYMRDGRIYRNTLATTCSPLGFEESFAYKTSIGRLCSLDTITVLQTPGRATGPTCGLGKFQPIELPDR